MDWGREEKGRGIILEKKILSLGEELVVWGKFFIIDISWLFGN